MRCLTAFSLLAIGHAAYACPPDLDGDGAVGGADLSLMLSGWGSPGPADLDASGSVDGSDLSALLGAWGPCAEAGVRSVDLAARSLSAFPFAQRDASFNAGATVWAAIDPDALDLAVGAQANLFVVADRDEEGWAADSTLADVRGSSQPFTLAAGGLQANVVALTGSASLSSAGGAVLGVAYDLVLDVNRNGILDGGDAIDGLQEPGFLVVKDPATAGPYATTTATYVASGATSGYTSAKVYYPTSIASLGQVPVVVISHGNGHQYTWYDYLGTHLAGWGFVVMSHQNNTVPGIETCSLTTLQHTGAIFAQQATIAGGALSGHLDASRIIWIGHSRGGEGICRGYDRLFDGSWTPPTGTYSLAGIRLLIPIAPTDFLGHGVSGTGSDPHGCPLYLLYGAADGDVCGCPDNNVADSFNLYERATGDKGSLYLHGADHNDFNCCGLNDFAGPSGTALGTTVVQSIAKAAILCAIQWRLGTSAASGEYLWRQWEDLRPPSNSSTATVVRDFVPQASGGIGVIDDFQTQTATGTSSSGGSIVGSVTNRVEGLMSDINTNFSWLTTDPHNGATRVGSGDTQRCTVFDWTGPTTLDFGLVTGFTDLTQYRFLQVRAAQGTRHPNTVAQSLTSLTFSITLVDQDGATSTISAGAFGGGIQRPYLRTGYGTGAGWQNEFETVRVRIADFAASGNPIDLTRVATVRLAFGTGAGTASGRLQVDDLLLLEH